MVDARALKVAAVVAVAAVVLFLASFVVRFVSRILAWAVLLVLALAAGYVVYQLYSGWRAAGDAEAPADADGVADVAVDEDAAAGTGVEDVTDRYTSGELSEAELEAELETVVGDEGVDDRESEPER